MAQTCQKVGCTRAATHALQIGVPDVRDPDSAPPRARVLMGVVVCEEHLEESTPGPFFEASGDTLRPIITMAMGHGAQPDYDRAVMLGVSVESAEYKALQLQRLTGSGLN